MSCVGVCVVVSVMAFQSYDVDVRFYVPFFFLFFCFYFSTAFFSSFFSFAQLYFLTCLL